MAKNTGTLVIAAIRPNDDLDTIASAWASEIKGGLHTVQNTTKRNSIFLERREWGMMCYVIDDNKTYQLTYNYVDANIMNNANWKEFSGSGSGSGNEWVDSVFSIDLIEPLSPTNGDRYLLGLDSSQALSGTNWSSIQSSQIVQWNSDTNNWILTVPKEGMSVRVDDQDNSIYRYEGNFPSGYWQKEKLGQVRSFTANTANQIDYTATVTPLINDYTDDSVFLVKFSAQNIGTTASLDINSLGQKYIKKTSPSGVVDLVPSDIQPGVVYTVVFDGTDFQLNKPYINDDVFNVKYLIEPSDYIVVPPNYQYWVYSDLTIQGTLVNYGKVIIANGSLILNGGTWTNQGSGQLVLLSLNTGMTSSFNDSDTIDFSQENTVMGLSVSAIVKDNSLTASKLDTGSNGGATAGYILSVDSLGKFNWLESLGTSGTLTSSDKNFIMSTNTSGDNQFSGLTISQTPLSGSYVGVFVNGQEFQVGYGTSVGVPCYFSNDGGITAKSTVVAGDGLYWNGTFVGTDLYSTWRISLYYMS